MCGSTSMLVKGGVMDGFTRTLLEDFLADPTKSDESKRLLGNSLAELNGAAVSDWCPMGE
jgi:hypothetical protein